ncbi:right-handed parallel beta-helix repeat-containing protein [Parachitinimonas caeni]|uniref:Right-handed parallel beta-helix repeat-containing protein n=1 Tax=Parachitinimonas caeni TaxID=3031301 RepID=A0ABT7DZJ0_9NEIS|nr:right-handed parallel beta-helix repeat-containing protein [Parachitinimonas caeni]MDK2125479.1 right-handed parallel beta-helix repeat-containing protein [Parachitinimonas caeni]
MKRSVWIGAFLSLTSGGAQAELAGLGAITAGTPSASELYFSLPALTPDKGGTQSLWLAASVPGSTALYVHTATGWQTLPPGQEPAPLFSTTQAITLLDALGTPLDLSQFAGTRFYVGVGSSWTEMLTNQRYGLAYTVPTTPSVVATYYVASNGSDSGSGSSDQPWASLTRALASATPGTRILVRGGIYHEQVTINRSGTANEGYLSIEAYPGETPVFDGNGIRVPNGTSGLFQLTDVSYVRVSGFELRNYVSNTASATPAGIYVSGAGSHIELRDNRIHDIQTTVNSASGNAFGIAVYGNRAPASINALTINGNELYQLKTGSSESLSINGNVQYFSVSHNRLHDNNNIGIDIIGYEGTSPDPAYDRARDGLISNNIVTNISSYGNPAYGNNYSAGGLYVDGGTRLLIEQNRVAQADIGIEVTSEKAQGKADYVLVRNNLVYRNNQAGISIGGYDAQRGGTDHCQFVNNTLFENDSKQTGTGEFLVQHYASDNLLANNIVQANSQGLFYSEVTKQSSAPVTLDGNLYFSETTDGGGWQRAGSTATNLATWQKLSGQDGHSQSANPLLVDSANFNFAPTAASPARGRARPLDGFLTGLRDFNSAPRTKAGNLDIGAIAY